MSEVFEYLGNRFLTNRAKDKTSKNEESKSQGPVATIKDINGTNTKNAQIKLSAQPKGAQDKKKKKGFLSMCSVH